MGLPKTYLHFRLAAAAVAREQARASLRMAHAVGWAMGGEKQQREAWHRQHEMAAGFLDRPLGDDAGRA